MKKLCIFGDVENSSVHPVAQVCRELEGLFGKEYDVTVSNFDASLSYEQLSAFDGVVFYTGDFLKKTNGGDCVVPALVTYVANGGGLMVIHNLDMTRNEQLACLLGCRPTYAMPYGPTTYRIFQPDHIATIMGDKPSPLSEGLEDFTVNDEAWFYINNPFLYFDAVLRTKSPTYEPDLSCAAIQSYGKGRIAVMGPGHSMDAFLNETYREILTRAARYTAGDLKKETEQ